MPTLSTAVLSRLQGLLGIAVLLAIAWAMSSNRKKIHWRVIFWGIGLQLVFALVILKTEFGASAFEYIRLGATRLLSFSDSGSEFLFGNLYRGIESSPAGKPGWSLALIDSKTNQPVTLGFVIAFHVLPVIIFFSSLMAVLYHIGLMQKLVQGFSFLMQKTMRISGAESLAVAANVFVGMVEAPMAVRPFVAKMTLSELTTVMTAGFATVAGSMMATYIRLGIDAGHVIAASVMSAPASIVIAKLIFPESEASQTAGSAKIAVERQSVNVIDAAATGATQGLKIAAIVGAMLIAFISLIAMVNYGLAFLGTSLGSLLGYLFSPLAFVIGIDGENILKVGQLLGTKISINEFVAYLDLISLKDQLNERSYIISTYALCGFANFGSLAILLGGVGSIAPSRRADLARLGLRTMFGGALASWLTAAIAGILI